MKYAILTIFLCGLLISSAGMQQVRSLEVGQTFGLVQEPASEQETETCDPPCQNGGVCKIGKCYCPNNYIGKQCEQDMTKNIRIDTKMALVICVLSILLGCIFVWVMTFAYQKVMGYTSQPVVRTREVYYEHI